MKKSIFILAAMFAATFANAQITLLHTFESWATISVNPYADMYGYDIVAPYFYEMSIPKEANGVVTLYNTGDFSVYKAIQTPHVGSNLTCYLVSRNILTTDNKVCFAISNEGDGSNNIYIYNEDAQLIATIKGQTPSLVMVEDRYYLITHGYTYAEEGDKYYTCIYSVPGNGESGEDVSAPIVPRNSRKVIKKDQVVVENADKTYTLQGQEVK